MIIGKWLKMAAESNASDIFIGAGRRVSLKINGIIVAKGGEPISAPEAGDMVKELFLLANRSMDDFLRKGDDDFPITLSGIARFRVSAYNQRGTHAAVIRVVLFELPDYKELNIHEDVMKIAQEKNGLVLVTGPAGSGKSTTLACIIDAINKTRNCHIITLEDPIEYLHRDRMSLVSQREISTDTESYLAALRAALRQAPDIVLLGEMRDHETIKTAMTAAETGHLIISTLHTVGAVNTIDRIVDVFPPQQQQQVRVQLSMLLRSVVSQQLLITKSGGITPAFEIMNVNSAIRNLIRESKTHQIDNAIQTSAGAGMISMDNFILNLFQNGEISYETAIGQAANPEQMVRFLERIK
ncbi:MAG: PilT/PilU family type 4a pilus ATPase [Clostridiales bacterium]|jgi:twitching motility protein PilT|nr:PilT/PilU family type 4a pilus ATPase [Clostridiales bacterium]